MLVVNVKMRTQNLQVTRIRTIFPYSSNLPTTFLISGSKKKRTDSGKDETDNESVSDASTRHSELTGFDKGLEAEKILGASDSNGGLYFLIQFKGVDQAEMVAASVANVKIPQMVIKFYEERLSWYSDNEE